MSRTCYIIDDEPLAVEVITAHVERYGALRIEGRFSNAMKAFQALSTHPADVLFLDIEMPGITGVELLGSLAKRPAVVLTTAHRAYAVQGYELDVVDYLLKPISFDRFLKAMAKVERALGREAQDQDPGEQEPPESKALMLRSNHKNVRIALEDIAYMESQGDVVELVTTGGPIQVRKRLGAFAEELRPNGFMRIHRSFVVRLAAVESWTASEVRVGGQPLPIGRTFKSDVARRLGAGPQAD